MAGQVLLADVDPAYTGPTEDDATMARFFAMTQPHTSKDRTQGKVVYGLDLGPTKEDFTMASFFAAATTTSSKDDTPDWAYDEDGYCVCCGNGKWKYHMPECELRDALDTPDYEAGYKAWFWSGEDLDEKEAFELGVKVAVGLETPSTNADPHHHPSWSIKHCPYPDGHKPGCSWWSGSAWVETGITPDK